MDFSKKLNYYIEKIGCTAKELSTISGISPSTLSRYRNGKLTPKYQSEQFKLLIICGFWEF